MGGDLTSDGLSRAPWRLFSEQRTGPARLPRTVAPSGALGRHRNFRRAVPASQFRQVQAQSILPQRAPITMGTAASPSRSRALGGGERVFGNPVSNGLGSSEISAVGAGARGCVRACGTRDSGRLAETGVRLG